MNLLPQLPSIKAKVILEDIASKSNCETLDPKGNFKVEGIFYVPTGGQIINDENLEKLRNNVLEKAKEYGFPSTNQKSFLEFEYEVAKILSNWSYLWIDGEPSGESFRNDFWSYLSIVIMPDIVSWRWGFPPEGEPTKSWSVRFIGGGRNAFQRIFRRILSLDRGPSHEDRFGLIRELKEDDFSNILERTSLGSNSRIAIPLAEEYLAMRQRRKDMKASNQLKIYREATKDLRSYGVVQSLDLIDSNNLKELISEVFLKREEEVINEIKQSNRGLVSSTKSLLKKVIKID
ncbi:MAG: hypothetical protein CMD05_00065 [Flavobacteriales bacterium]|nr:hypothetical protein [Flavobacteriales bacterium]